MRIISRLIHRNECKQKQQSGWTQLTKEQHLQDEYILHTVRVCSLAQVSHKKKKRLKAEDIEKRICNDGVLMVSVGNDIYMDIETKEQYELGALFGEELNYPEKDLYVASTKPMYYTCYETIQQKNLDPNDKVSVKELRNIYNEHFRQFTR